MDRFGVYVHIPFCTHRCDYCAFATWTDRHHLQRAYAAACVGEITAGDLAPATSVFFGGGTPSLLDPGLLAAILDSIPRARGAEVTVECNPDTVTAEAVAVYRRAGVTRLSFGVQSMVSSVLHALGREHEPEAVRRAVQLARAEGFENFNLDLIYGAAGESRDDWARTLDQALALDPPHVSAYALTVEPGTPLARDQSRHPDDDDLASKYVDADRRLGAEGLTWYEVSNWARSGYECRHNRLYWEGGSYRGIGCAAHSFDGHRRWWNVRTPERYIAAIGAGRSAEAAGEELAPSARAVEALSLRLRTSDGVPLTAIAPDDRQEIAELVEVRAGRLVLTVRGRLLANEVAVRLRVR